jgi:hypothetical protein
MMQFDAVESRRWTDDQVLAQCRLETFRGPGPGGQKRNKTSSAVRLTHEPTGLSATAGESRSQAENRRRALSRLRLSMVTELRRSLDMATFRLPRWFDAHRRAGAGGLRISARNADFLAVAGLVLDVLAAVGWSISDAARVLRISSANLSRLLQLDESIWAKVNQSRAAAGLRSLISG